jgi:hypothetical protein
VHKPYKHANNSVPEASAAEEEAEEAANMVWSWAGFWFVTRKCWSVLLAQKSFGQKAYQIALSPK